MESMEREKLFRLSTFLYFIDKISTAEGSTDAVRREIWTMLEKLPATTPLVARIVEMDTKERLQALSHLINLLKTFAAGVRTITNKQWVARIDRIFMNDDDDDDDDDNGGDVAVGDAANSIYELLAVKVPGGGELDFLGTVIIGCNLVSLDGLCLLTGIPEPFASQIKQRIIGTGNFWRVKCPFRGIELFVNCNEAAMYCRTYCLSPKGQAAMHWLDTQELNPPSNPAYRQRFRLLEAVDSTKYVITFLSRVPSAGHMVLIRALDGHVHVASFMKACVGLPLTEMDVWDDQCASLTELLNGPVNLRLAEGQIQSLTIPIPPPVIKVHPPVNQRAEGVKK